METVPVVEPPRSAFDIMMNKKLQPLAEMKGTDKHTELRNTVVKAAGGDLDAWNGVSRQGAST